MKVTRGARLGALVGGVALLLTACGSASGLTLGPPATVETSAGTDAPTIPGCEEEVLSDCFTSEEDMQLLFDYVQTLVTAWGEEVAPDVDEVGSWIYVPTGESGDEGCTDYTGSPAQYTDESYEFCGPDETIYVGEQLMWFFFQGYGDAGPSIGIAHEWGHHLQWQTGAWQEVDDQESYIALENQADCVAGAWFRSEIRAGRASRSDLVDVGKILALISEAEGPDRTHGTLKEREASFFFGVAQGLDYCNSYFPDAPIYEGDGDG